MTQPTIEQMIEWLGLKDGELWASDDDEKMFRHVCAALTAQALPEDGFQRGREYGLKEALNCVCEIHKDFARSNAAWNAISQALKAINKKRVKVKREKLAAIAAAEDGAG